MTIQRFFDYIFYRVTDSYINKWKDEQGMIYGVGVVSVMQITHIMFILLVFALFFNNVNDIFFKQREGFNFMHSGIIYPCLIVLAYNFFRYFKFFSFERAKKQWVDEEKESRRKNGKHIVFYIVLNLGITIFLSIYRRYIL